MRNWLGDWLLRAAIRVMTGEPKYRVGKGLFLWYPRVMIGRDAYLDRLERQIRAQICENWR